MNAPHPFTTVAADAAAYIPGFANHVSTEAVPGALPVGRNSPQRPAFGLYAEQLSGTDFTAPRHENRRSWLYRMRPTAEHPPFTPYEGAPMFAGGGEAGPLAPNRLRWNPVGNAAPGTVSAGDGPGTVPGTAQPAVSTTLPAAAARSAPRREARNTVAVTPAGFAGGDKPDMTGSGIA